MSQATAQIVLTLILLAGAVVFVLLGQNELAVALVGAIAGELQLPQYRVFCG